MGTSGHVVVVGPDAGRAEELVTLAERLSRQLEAQWSRFDPASEVSALNQSNGQPIQLSPETFDLVAKSLAANALTNGRFDPTLLPTLEALGYDRTFSAIVDSDAPLAVVIPSGNILDIELDEAAHTVRMNHGATFDPGGIGKGLAADIVSQRIMDAGAHGVLVNLGGDIRVRGSSPTNEPAWIVAIREPAYTEDVIATVALSDAALATSTTLRRSWTRSDALCHHLIDPTTLAPTEGSSLVSTIATTGWWAEASATALAVNRHPSIEGVPYLSVDADGPHRANGFHQFELETSQ